MSSDLLQRLEDGLADFTAAERSIANYILTSRSAIAFETANSIAAKLGVSAITVGRFSRKMGYRHFKDLKGELKTSMSGVPWLVGEQLADFIGSKDGSNRTKQSLELELAGIIEVYSLAETEVWKQITALFADVGTIYIIGFQTERGVAHTLAHLLQYAREDVRLVDPASGNYHEIFAGGKKDCCLVIVDIVRYSIQSYRLAEMASRENIPLVVITDKFCDWARTFTPNVLALPTDVELFWRSQVALSCVVNLLVNDVIRILGAKVEKRLERLSELYQTYTGHVGGVKTKKTVTERK